MGPGGQAKKQNGNVWIIFHAIKSEKKGAKYLRFFFFFFLEEKKPLVFIFWKERNVFQAGTLQYSKMQHALLQSARQTDMEPSCPCSQLAARVGASKEPAVCEMGVTASQG